MGRLIVTHGYHKTTARRIATAIRHFKRIGAHSQWEGSTICQARCLHGSSSAAVVGAYWCSVIYHGSTSIQCRIHVDIGRAYDLG